MTPEEHLALAHAEYDEGTKQVERQMYETPDQRFLASQAESLLAIAEILVETQKRKRWFKRG